MRSRERRARGLRRVTTTATAVTVAAVVAIAALGASVGPAAAQRTLVGYASELSVRAGDTVEFKVSSILGEAYFADLVRVVNGDSQSRYAGQFQVVDVEAPFEGTYEGQPQPLNLGSYLHVEETRPIDRHVSVTIGAYVFPTFVPGSEEEAAVDPFSPPTLTIADRIGSQTIVSRFDKTAGRGWALQIDAEGHLAFVAGDGNGEPDRVRLAEPVRTWDWAHVSATYDHKTGHAEVRLVETPTGPGDAMTARSLRAEGELPRLVHEGPLRVGAVRDGPGAVAARFEKPGDVFNGRIQDVRIVKRVLDEKLLVDLRKEKIPRHLKDHMIVDYDFGRRIGKTTAQDISTTRLHAELVNLPQTAVRGLFWDRRLLDWREKKGRESYDAIHFHADDLYDAEWQTDFEYTVPDTLRSGIYAARVTDGAFTDYVPFFVAPVDTVAVADLAVWVSEYSYMAHSNVSLVVTARDHYPGHNFNEDDAAFLAANEEYATGGVYNKHVDGQYFTYGSRLRPDLHMKPGGLVYNFVQDTHLVAFLEHEGIAYDIITDQLVHEEGVELLERYRVVMSGSHPEYVTLNQFDAVEDYLRQGGRFVYTGGNGWFWSVSTPPEHPGAIESRNFMDWSERFLLDGSRGGAIVETGRSSAALTGVEMSGMVFHGSGHYRKTAAATDPRAAFLFEGVEGETFGDYGVDRVQGGAAGFEIDRANFAGGTPRHALVVARSENLPPPVEDVKLLHMPLGITYHPIQTEPWAEANLVFFETPDGGAVLSTGSIAWISSTLENDFDNDVARITRNALRRFLDPEPFPPVPAADVRDVHRVR